MDKDSNPFSGVADAVPGGEAVSSIVKVPTKSLTNLPLEGGINGIMGDQVSGMVMQQISQPPGLYVAIGLGVFVVVVVGGLTYLTFTTLKNKKEIKRLRAVAEGNTVRAAQLRVQIEETRGRTAQVLSSNSGAPIQSVLSTMGLTPEGQMPDKAANDPSVQNSKVFIQQSDAAIIDEAENTDEEEFLPLSKRSTTRLLKDLVSVIKDGQLQKKQDRELEAAERRQIINQQLQSSQAQHPSGFHPQQQPPQVYGQPQHPPRVQPPVMQPVQAPPMQPQPQPQPAFQPNPNQQFPS